MTEIVYQDSEREESERGRRVHDQWRQNRPIEVPRAIRYVTGLIEPSEGVPRDFTAFSQKYSLDDKVTVLGCASPIGWTKEFNDWIMRGSKVRIMDHAKGHFVYPATIYDEEVAIRKKLVPVSLRYVVEKAHPFYKMRLNDMGPKATTLVFYDDKLTARIGLENYREDTTGPSAAPNGTLVVTFVDGQKHTETWSAWAGSLNEYLERTIRKKLGEPTESFELHGAHLLSHLRR